MKEHIVVDDPDKIIPLKNYNICPFCMEQTAYPTGSVHACIVKNLSKEFECYHCSNYNCTTNQYYILKSLYDEL
jgi:hypothetical protein